MRKSKARRLDWRTKLSTVPHLADDIAELLTTHEEGCISRAAAVYWLERAGLTERGFLFLWSQGGFRG